MGMVRQNQGRPQEAVRSFKRALAIDPNDAYALGEIGSCVPVCGSRGGRQEGIRGCA